MGVASILAPTTQLPGRAGAGAGQGGLSLALYAVFMSSVVVFCCCFFPKQALCMYSRYGMRLNTYPCFRGSYTEHQETLPAADQETERAQEPPGCWLFQPSSLPGGFCFRRGRLVLLPAFASVIAGWHHYIIWDGKIGFQLKVQLA